MKNNCQQNYKAQAILLSKIRETNYLSGNSNADSLFFCCCCYGPDRIAYLRFLLSWKNK